jgi:hypothetical protein
MNRAAANGAEVSRVANIDSRIASSCIRGPVRAPRFSSDLLSVALLIQAIAPALAFDAKADSGSGAGYKKIWFTIVHPRLPQRSRSEYRMHHD